MQKKMCGRCFWAQLSTIAALLLALGCSVELEVPEDASVACQSDPDCPQTHTCVADRCVPRDRTDVDAPAVVSADVPSYAGLGELRVELSVSEPLGRAPEVRLALGSEIYALGLDPDGSSLEDYAFVYTVVGDEPETQGSVVADLVDRVGNTARAVPVGSVRVDYTAPQLVRANLTPRSARLGETIIYSLTASEDLAEPPSLRVVGLDSATGPASFFAPIADTTYRFEHRVVETDADGAYAVTVDLVDLAGNRTMGITSNTEPSTPEAQLEDFVVDATSPSISAVSIVSADAPLAEIQRINAASTLQVSFIASDGAEEGAATIAPAEIEVFAGTYALSCRDSDAPSYLCQLDMSTVAADDGDDVPQSLVVRATDAAGNVATWSNVIVFDFNPPRVAADSLSYTPAFGNVLPTVQALGNGATLAVNINTNEPLSAVPTLLLECGDASEPMISAGGQQSSTFFQFELQIEASHGFADGSCILRAGLRDVAGNSSSEDLSVHPIVDRTAPSTAVINTAQIKHLRAPWRARVVAAGQYIVRHDLPEGVDPLSAGEAIPGAAFDDPSLTRYLVYLQQSGGPILGNGGRQDAGWQPIKLGFLDSPEAWVAVVDEAGNVSERVRVEQGEWVASMGRKVANSMVENPHIFESRAWLTDSAQQGGSFERGADDGIADYGADTFTTRGAATWKQYETAQLPHRRSGPAFVYDHVTAKVFMFGGYYSGGCNESNYTNMCRDHWLWDGRGWSALPVPNDLEGDGSPIGEQLPAMVHDRMRDQLLGLGVNNGDEGLWTWNRDTHSWYHLVAEDPEGDGNPPPTWPFQMAYDVARGESVYPLWNDDTSVFETWIWDGTSWRKALSDSAPSERSGFALAYDAARAETILFGGYGECASWYCNDTWTWDGFAWTQRGPPTPLTADNNPDGRSEAQLAYDSRRERIVLFGGSCSYGANCTDTWEWDGASWSRPVLSDPEGDGEPDERSRASMVYDAARGLVLLYGGQGATSPCDGSSDAYCDTLWGWNGSSWRRLAGGGPIPNLEPTPRTNTNLAVDPTTHLLVSHGGIADEDVVCDGAPVGDYSDRWCDSTWLWDQTSWAEVVDATGPGLRYGALLAPALYNDGTGDKEVLLLYGGSTLECSGTCTIFNVHDTWIRNQSGWIDPGVADLTVSTSSASAIYDAQKGETWIITRTASVNKWSPNGWASVPCSNCSGKDFSATAFDSDRRKLVAFVENAVWEAPIDEVPLAWTQVDDGTTGGPVVQYPSVAYDPERGTTVLFGGKIGYVLYSSAVWEWDGTQWSQLEIVPLEGVPEPHDRPAMVHDPYRSEIVIYGGRRGQSAETVSNQMWALRTGYDSRPAHVMKARLRQAGLDETRVHFESAHLVWFVRGSGETAGQANDGATLWVWRAGHWLDTESSNTASTGDTAGAASWRLDWSGVGDAAVRELLSGEQREIISVALPVGSNGRSSASIETDYVETRVRYTFQP